MSNTFGVCRICLATDVRMLTIAGTPLQIVYEKFTNSSLHKEKRPVVACYVCYAQLKRSHRLMLTSINAELALTEILQTFTELTPASVATIDRKKRPLSNLLSVCPMRHTDCSMAGLDVTVKSEPVWRHSEMEEGLEASGQSFDFVSVPATPCAATVEVMIKVEPQETKTEPVSPSHTDTADQTNSDTNDELPLNYVATVMADGKPQEGIHKNKRAADTQKPSQKSTQDKEEKTHECYICERKFKVKGGLNEHLRTHSGEKPYECNICKYKFTKKINLDIHLRTHTGEKPFGCDMCKRKFSEAVNLRRHVRTHTGEKPHACDVCKRRFNEAVNLKRHKRTHTGEKPFQCPYPSCDDRFSQKVTLDRHVRRHTGEKPYKCNICYAKFLAKGGLSRHMRTHAEGQSGFGNDWMEEFATRADEKPLS